MKAFYSTIVLGILAAAPALGAECITGERREITYNLSQIGGARLPYVVLEAGELKVIAYKFRLAGDTCVLVRENETSDTTHELIGFPGKYDNERQIYSALYGIQVLKQTGLTSPDEVKAAVEYFNAKSATDKQASK